MSKRSIMPATSTPIRLPQETILNIIGWLDPEDIIRLRRSSLQLPEWLGIILSDRELYHALRRYRMQSHRPPLTTFDKIPTGLLDLEQREKMVQQHMSGRPYGEVRKELGNLTFCDYLYIHGPLIAFSAQETQNGANLLVVMHLLHQKAIKIRAISRIKAVTLTDTLFAFGDSENFYVGRLEELDFDGGVVPQPRMQKLSVNTLTGKRNEIAINDLFSVSTPSHLRSVRIYDYTTDSMSEPITEPAVGIFYNERLWIVTTKVTDKLLLTFKSPTRTVEMSADRLPGWILRLTARETGDELQIVLSWFQSDGSTIYQNLILRDFKLVTSFLGECTVWRGKRHVAIKGGIQIETHKVLGQLLPNHLGKESLAINDSFLVMLDDDARAKRVSVYTMVFDRSINLPYTVITGSSPECRWRSPKYDSGMSLILRDTVRSQSPELNTGDRAFARRSKAMWDLSYR